jgi:hypothetical protein
MSDELKWSVVGKIHRTVRGMAVREGRLVSLLCNQQKAGPYPDRIADGRLTYFLGRRSGPYRIERMIEFAEESTTVRVFEKLGKNRWLDLGEWVFDGAEEPQGEMVPFIFRVKGGR